MGFNSGFKGLKCTLCIQVAPIALSWTPCVCGLFTHFESCAKYYSLTDPIQANRKIAG